MIYPKNLNKNDYIGVIATSKGISKDTEILKFEKAKENFKSYGHNIIESSNIMKNDKARSSSGKERAEEFLKLWTNKDVKAIITLKGDAVVQTKNIENYREPGYEALDSYDGDLTWKVQRKCVPDEFEVGKYIFIYSVSDSSGNTATIERIAYLQGNGY